MRNTKHFKEYTVERRPSFFVSRNGQDDVRVFRQGEHHPHLGRSKSSINGKWQQCVGIYAAETGEEMRRAECFPEEIKAIIKEFCD